MGCSDVVPLVVEDALAIELPRSSEQSARMRREVDVVAEVSPAGGLVVRAGDELELSELAQGLQHPEPRARRLPEGDDERLVDQTAELIDDV